MEWREEDVCVKVPQNTCKTVSRISPTKVFFFHKVSIVFYPSLTRCAVQRRWRSADGW